MTTSIRPSTFSHELDTEMLESLSRSRINSLEQLATRPYSGYSLKKRFLFGRGLQSSEHHIFGRNEFWLEKLRQIHGIHKTFTL